MAWEPLDSLEQRRWSASTKFYTRKKKGKRNSNSSAATSASAAASSEPASVSANDEVSKGTEIGNWVSNGELKEPEAPDGERNRNGLAARTTSPSVAASSEPGTVSVSDEVTKGAENGNGVLNRKGQEGDGQNGKHRQPEAAVLVKDPSRELPTDDCYRLGQEEEPGGGGEVPVSAAKERLVSNTEVIVPTENGVGETVGQEAGDSPRGTAGRLSEEVVVLSAVGSQIEQEEGSSNNMLQPVTEMVDDDELSQEVGDSHGDAAKQNGTDLLVDGKETLLSSGDDDQSQHENGPSGEIVSRGSNEMLPESREVSLMKNDRLVQETANSRRKTTVPSSSDGQSGHEEVATHLETSLGSDDVLPENGAALGHQEDDGRLEQGEGVSGGETVRISDGGESLESKEAVPQHSSEGDVADVNEVMMQNKPHQDLQQRPSLMTRVDDKIRINVTGARSGDEVRGVKRKLETELDQVRSLFKRLNAKELQITASNCNLSNGIISNADAVDANNINNTVITYGDSPGNFDAYVQPRYDALDRTLTRVSSEVGSMLHRPNKLFNRSLSVSVADNNYGVGEFVEREKRTPKSNQLYRNSEFLLGKDRLPSESNNKKLKSNGFATDKNRVRAFKSCSTLLQRLMKHNFGWVFNEPVDARKLGLHDYHDIIKHPMDLGTIKIRLSQNFYKSLTEFADDVRLVFHNAMTYNPKGHDVNVMADTLLNMFEERWVVIEKEYNRDWRYQMYQDVGLTTPTSRKIHASQFYIPTQVPTQVPTLHAPHVPAQDYTSVAPVPPPTILDNSLMMMNTTPSLRPPNTTLVGRTPAPKKPKARDPHKRGMTYDEKQKLSTNLQSLPSEKLDALVQIIKKRNSTLSQDNDEIEVDIDSVDAETLWELDRFVTNYKKSLSKNKRKAELALQTRAEAGQTTVVMNTIPGTMVMQKDTRIGDNDDRPVQVEKQGDHASRSSSSSSSSSDSGSSSSDSDSDSSSSCGSDSRRSPRT